jgi:hypothetical protein
VFVGVGVTSGPGPGVEIDVGVLVGGGNGVGVSVGGSGVFVGVGGSAVLVSVTNIAGPARTACGLPGSAPAPIKARPITNRRARIAGSFIATCSLRYVDWLGRRRYIRMDACEIWAIAKGTEYGTTPFRRLVVASGIGYNSFIEVCRLPALSLYLLPPASRSRYCQSLRAYVVSWRWLRSQHSCVPLALLAGMGRIV